MWLDRGRMLDGSRERSTFKKPSVFVFLIRRIPIQDNVYWPWTDKKCKKPRGYWSWTDGRIKYTSVPPPNLPRQVRSGGSRGDEAPTFLLSPFPSRWIWIGCWMLGVGIYPRPNLSEHIRGQPR